MTTITTSPKPVLGPLAKQALQLKLEGRKRRKLLVLLAAYADADVQPSARMLRERMGDVSAGQVDALLKALERDGLIRVGWRAGPGEDPFHRRNTYELLMAGSQR
jgi:DNA-binding PadR family transcriptional regulator